MSSNTIIEELSKYAYAHGVQHEVFSHRDSFSAQDHLEKLIEEFKPAVVGKLTNSKHGTTHRKA